MNNTAIGLRIRESRKKIGLTQVKMAEKLGISAAYLNLIESNKRGVGGDLLKRIANELNLDVQTLSGAYEQRLSDDLQALTSSPLFDDLDPSDHFAQEIVATHPKWARMMLILYRAYLDRSRALTVISDRLNRDTELQTSVHRMLSQLTAIRSVSEILNSASEISTDQRDRFHKLLQVQSTELTNVTQQLVSYFDTQQSTNPTAAIAEQVDEFIISKQNYFPGLEQAADKLRETLSQSKQLDFDGALISFLSEQLNIQVKNEAFSTDGNIRYKNQCRMDETSGTLYFVNQASVTTKRFQMLTAAAKIVCKPALDKIVSDPTLSSFAAKRQAFSALAAYVAGAVLMPYERFRECCEEVRYDIDVLRQLFNVGYEQVCHRLVTLRRLGEEGIPFAFMRVDPSGHISKRFPLPRFPLPRYGHICPLWPVFSAFQTPEKINQTLAEFPNGNRFLMISRTTKKRSAAFYDPPVVYSIMLVCDILYADRLVYSEGLNLAARGASLKVGPSCNQCARQGCPHRQEAAWTLIK